MLNRVVLIGRMGKDPELRTTTNGKSVANFSLAVNGRFSKDKTDWFSVICWGSTAEFVSQYLGKGRLVAIEGGLSTRKYTTQDGSQREVVEIVADNVQGLDRASEGQGTTTQEEEWDPFGDE